MRSILILLAASLALWGCSGNSAENEAEKSMPAGTGQALYPNGKQLPPDLQRMADARTRGQQAAASGISQQMQAMAAARARAGGK